MYLLLLPITESVSIQFSFSHGVEPFSIDILRHIVERFSTRALHLRSPRND